ncbi:hypothetical protein B0H10DRAFT_2438100 [Mycena sp. CBHHK59/15]|nr:hypothetical protein B0H10DRAFT_2442843 [Mycena sp. CBHHK59/15]KAJ6610267.1 hypothetical protein B0H10DRAFT_2438100 [Mycena sp. CBHHK59/15]
MFLDNNWIDVDQLKEFLERAASDLHPIAPESPTTRVKLESDASITRLTTLEGETAVGPSGFVSRLRIPDPLCFTITVDCGIGSFTLRLACTISQDLQTDICLGLDWVSCVRQWCLDRGFSLPPNEFNLNDLFHAVSTGRFYVCLARLVSIHFRMVIVIEVTFPDVVFPFICPSFHENYFLCVELCCGE